MKKIKLLLSKTLSLFKLNKQPCCRKYPTSWQTVITSNDKTNPKESLFKLNPSTKYIRIPIQRFNKSKDFLFNNCIVANASAVNANAIKMLLANGLSRCFINAIHFLVMVLKVYLKILLIFLLYSADFDHFILADKPFAKALQSLKTCVLVNNNLYGKLVSSLESPTAFD